MMLPVPQPQTAAYRSRSHRERLGRENSETNEAVKQGPVMPPPYRSRSHRENWGTDEPLPHGPGVLPPYKSRSHWSV